MSINITVQKSDLQKRLRENRDLHAENYAKAQEGFVKLLTEELEEKLKMIKEGKRLPILHFENRQPEDHTEEYDTIIGMLEMSVDTQLELTYQQYQNWVQDQWNWSQLWATSNTAYMAAAAR